MKLFVVSDVIAGTPFLASHTRQPRIMDVRLADKTIQEFLTEIPAIRHQTVLVSSRMIHTYQDLFSYLSDHHSEKFSITPETDITLFNARYFPRCLKDFDQMLKKAEYSELAIRSPNDASSDSLLLGRLKYSDIAAKKESKQSILSDSADVIEIQSDSQFLDLKNPSDVIELFAKNFSTRYFNEIKVGQVFITKKSNDVEKLRREFNFYMHLPQELRVFYPNVGQFFESQGAASYQIEKIFGLDAARLFVNGLFADSDIVDLFFRSLDSYIASLPTVKCDNPAEHLRNLVVKKNQVRIAKLLDSPLASKLDKIAQVNGFESVLKFSECIERSLDGFLKEYSDKKLSFSHGDLCLSNIIFNPESRQIKLIDPRGFEGDPSNAFQPLIYDLAKLSHSIFGYYDLILNGLTTCELDKNLKLLVSQNVNCSYVVNLQNGFKNLLESFNVSIREVRLIESSLFLSMLPLHIEDESRVAKLLVNAMQIYEIAR